MITVDGAYLDGRWMLNVKRLSTCTSTHWDCPLALAPTETDKMPPIQSTIPFIELNWT